MQIKDELGPVGGFLVVGLLMGALVGFACGDVAAFLNGFEGLSPSYSDRTAGWVAVGACVGLVGGWLADLTLNRRPQLARVVVRRLWALLALVLFLFLLVGPLVPSARE